MRTWPITNEEGEVTAFEVSMIRISLSEITRILQSNVEVSQLNRRRIFSSPSDVHLTFAYRGADYLVWEPFGDNSRYWVKPKDKPAHPHDVAELEQVFRAYKPSLLKRALGGTQAAKKKGKPSRHLSN